MFLGVDALRWQRLDPVVALAWAVQSIAEPLADAEDNPRLDSTGVCSGGCDGSG
jgi:hypothetical protein